MINLRSVRKAPRWARVKFRSVRKTLRWATSPEGVIFADRLMLFTLKSRYLLRKFVIGNREATSVFELTRPVRVKTKYGMRARVSDNFAYSMFVQGYEQELAKYLEQGLGRDDTFVDVGANLGVYTLLAASKTRGEIIAIEANKRFYGYLVQNVKLNNCPNIKCFHYAVWDRDNETVQIYEEDDVNYKGYNAGVVMVADRPRKSITPVETRTLDSIVIMQCKCSRVDWLKMDVEGAEVNVLLGASNTLRITRNILIEVHSKENGEKCKQIISDAGFNYDIIQTSSNNNQNYYWLHAFKQTR